MSFGGVHFRWLAVAVVSCCSFVALAQDNDANLIFRLGVFDRSSLEFSSGSPRGSVDILVGPNTSPQDWYATQAAESPNPPKDPRAKVAGSAAPRTIEFDIKGAPASAYRLHVAFLVKFAGVPTVHIGINDKQGTFYLHPELDFGVGDVDATPEFSHADIVFTFPGSYLHTGRNKLSFLLHEEPESTGIASEKPESAVGGLTYDAIELDRYTESFDPKASSAQVFPTIFFENKDGQLRELVDVFVSSAMPFAAVTSADLTVGKETYHRVSQTAQDFGEERFEFLVPEFTAQTQASLSWSIAGHTGHEDKTIDPMKKWTILFTPHIHIDVGFTDYQAKVAAVQVRAIDEAMDFTAQHPDFRYSVDGSWALEQFMRTRTEADQRRLITAMQNRQIFVPAQYAELLTGFASNETLIRSLYTSANFSRLHHTPFNYADITDVPSYSWSYPSILAAAGIHDFIAGMNGRNHRAPVLMQGHLNQTSPMWWVGPDGQKVLFWYSRGYAQMYALLGLPPTLAAGEETLPIFMQQYEHPNYRANAIILYGSQPENTDLYPLQTELVGRWNSVYAYPKIQYSGFYDALNEIAHQFGDDLPTIHGDGGPYWEDGAWADSFYAAMGRRNESRALSTEKLETLASLINSRVASDKASLDAMWTNIILFDEHTFDANVSVRDPQSEESVIQLATKHTFATQAREIEDWLTRNSMDTIANSIFAGPGSIIVYNTLNWPRSGAVTLDLGQGNVIVDPSTGHTLPVQVLRAEDRISRVRFIAPDVPATGYKVFLVSHGKSSPAPAISHSTTLENSYYRIELDPATGAVRSIYDKQLQRELVNQNSSYRFGQYLYVTGGEHEPNSIVQYRPISPRPVLDVHGAHDGTLTSVMRTPWGWSAMLKSTDTNTPQIETEIRLFDNEKKIEFVEDIDKTAVTSHEWVYFAFPFNMDHPQFQYEIQNGVVDPAKDIYPGGGHEWFSTQHWISVKQDGISGTVMPLDASLVTLGDINRGAWPTTFGDRPGSIFSYIMNNIWGDNFRDSQGGHFRFRYVVTSAPSTDPVALSRMGWEEVTPLAAEEIKPQDKAHDTPRPLDGKEGAFLHVPDNALLLETWKPAEDGNGTILRFLDLGGVSRTVTVSTPLLALDQVWRTDAVERNQKLLPVSNEEEFQLAVHPHEIITVRLVGKNTLRLP
jgi:alpha-mannosidase